jgi:hypothetical protein
MPYIRQTTRKIFDDDIDELISLIAAKTKGDDWMGVMNYIMSRLMMGVVLRKYTTISYPTLVHMNGIIETMKTELNERVSGTYEMMKQHMNGDVPEYAQHAASFYFIDNTNKSLNEV